MVVCTGLAVVTVITGGAAAPIAATIGTAAGSSAAVVGTGSAFGTAVGVGTAGGTIAGAGAAGTATGTAIGAVTGALSAAGVGGSGAGLGALVAGTGGWGLLAIGTSVASDKGEITYDCWKPVVHDMTKESSSGMLLKDLVCHPNVAKVTVTTGICTELPNIVIENIWHETFEIQYMFLHDTEKIACHAKPSAPRV